MTLFDQIFFGRRTSLLPSPSTPLTALVVMGPTMTTMMLHLTPPTVMPTNVGRRIICSCVSAPILAQSA
jgi:hypothetical protein